MVQMISPYGVKFRDERREPTAVDVRPGRVEHYLSRGWHLAEGEDFEVESSPDAALNPGEKVDLEAETPDVKADGENFDNGQPLGVDAVVKTAPASLPGLSGKTKEALEAIATNEGVEFDSDTSKPDLKRAIETKRAENASAAE